MMRRHYNIIFLFFFYIFQFLYDRILTIRNCLFQFIYSIFNIFDSTILEKLIRIINRSSKHVYLTFNLKFLYVVKPFLYQKLVDRFVSENLTIQSWTKPIKYSRPMSFWYKTRIISRFSPLFHSDINISIGITNFKSSFIIW